MPLRADFAGSPPPPERLIAKNKPRHAVQGLNGANGGLVVIDVASQASASLVNTGVGLPFNSPNDVAVHGPSGAILFSDPAYGYAQGFRPEPLVGHSVAMGGLQRSSGFPFTAHSKRWPWQMPPALPFLLVPDRIPPLPRLLARPSQVGNWVWRFDPATNSTTRVADGFLKPNGVVFSPDFKTVYVSDTGAVDGEPGNDASSERAAPGLYAFDVALDAGGLPTLRNRRLFGVCASGVPDGLKVDEQGNLYACVPAGVDVFSPTGQALGSIAVGQVGNLAFAGRQLLMLQEERVSALPMRVKGVRLPMQGKV